MLVLFFDCVFEFHHIDDSKKEYTPAKIFMLSRAKIDKELAKCIMLCANCHRIHHMNEEYSHHKKRVAGLSFDKTISMSEQKERLND